MKRRGIFLLTFILISVPISGQNNNHTQDTIPQRDTLGYDEVPIPIDTLDTDDKFTKIVLYDDYTWEYADMGRPVIDTAGFFDSWEGTGVHSFREIAISDLPEEVDLMLVDSLNSFCVPYQQKVGSGFKFRRTREHKGVDLSLKTGDTIRAAFNGIVRVSEGTRRTGGYGNLVVIRHTNGLETYYAHLSKRLVDSGEVVKAGEVIGLGGNTGRSYGAHLHFETRYKGHPFDPQRIIDFENGVLRDSIFTLKKHYFSIYSHYGQTDEESLAASQRIVHTIKSGDTLGALARRYNTTVSKICKLNGISSNKILRIGQRLIVR
ncbi:MAG: peptidoglycan DD-metalloendopeptidase family protein [Bacteroidales bacterium]|nr:peptidoglycan DD-metalloendopeptidase family protein [Bacteroidales bacterium]